MKNVFILILISFSAIATYAQQSFVASGGNANDGKVEVSYSIGQLSVNHETDGQNWAHEGVQQGYAVTEVGVENLLVSSLDIQVYPNPVVDNLFINIAYTGQHSFYALLLDADGKVLERLMLNGFPYSFNMSYYLGNKVYMLSIYCDDILIKNYKLIKHSL